MSISSWVSVADPPDSGLMKWNADALIWVSFMQLCPDPRFDPERRDEAYGRRIAWLHRFIVIHITKGRAVRAVRLVQKLLAGLIIQRRLQPSQHRPALSFWLLENTLFCKFPLFAWNPEPERTIQHKLACQWQTLQWKNKVFLILISWLYQPGQYGTVSLLA